MIKENSEIKSPNDILRNRKRSLRDRLQLAIYEFPPDYFTVTFADPNNAVLITEGEAGREAYFVYGRFKSKELHRKEGLPHNQPDGAADENDFRQTNSLATFSLSPDSDDEDALDDISTVSLFARGTRGRKDLKTRRESLNALAQEKSSAAN